MKNILAWKSNWRNTPVVNDQAVIKDPYSANLTDLLVFLLIIPSNNQEIIADRTIKYMVAWMNHKILLKQIRIRVEYFHFAKN